MLRDRETCSIDSIECRLNIKDIDKYKKETSKERRQQKNDAMYKCEAIGRANPQNKILDD